MESRKNLKPSEKLEAIGIQAIKNGDRGTAKLVIDALVETSLVEYQVLGIKESAKHMTVSGSEKEGFQVTGEDSSDVCIVTKTGFRRHFTGKKWVCVCDEQCIHRLSASACGQCKKLPCPHILAVRWSLQK